MQLCPTFFLRFRHPSHPLPDGRAGILIAEPAGRRDVRLELWAAVVYYRCIAAGLSVVWVPRRGPLAQLNGNRLSASGDVNGCTWIYRAHVIPRCRGTSRLVMLRLGRHDSQSTVPGRCRHGLTRGVHGRSSRQKHLPCHDLVQKKNHPMWGSKTGVAWTRPFNHNSSLRRRRVGMTWVSVGQGHDLIDRYDWHLVSVAWD
jgi:hypothetical protein